MWTRLPAFSGLVAFDATVRHGTLTGAAQELNVSQPAISRRLAALEGDLGCVLFDRGHKPLRLTQEGRELAGVLRSGLGQIEVTVDHLRRRASHGVVTVSAPSGFVGYWLIHQLGDLEADFPDLTIRIISQEYGEPERPGDVSVRFGLPDPGVAGEERVLGDQVFAVASPLYLQKRGLTPQDAARFDGVTLLTMETTQGQWYDWSGWFAAVGQVPGRVRHLDFSSYAMVVNAALAGQGICLCWSGLLGDFLDSGAMLRIGDREAISERGYYLALREGQAARHEVRAVCDWLRERGFGL